MSERLTWREFLLGGAVHVSSIAGFVTMLITQPPDSGMAILVGLLALGALITDVLAVVGKHLDGFAELGGRIKNPMEWEPSALAVVGMIFGMVALCFLWPLLAPAVIFEAKPRRTHRQALRLARLQSLEGKSVEIGKDKCKHCSHSVPVGAKHCTSCGKALYLPAPSKLQVCPCGGINSAAAEYCSECGSRLTRRTATRIFGDGAWEDESSSSSYYHY